MSAQYGSTKPRIDARLEGTQVFTAPVNTTSEHVFPFYYDTTFNGIDFYAFASSEGDNITLETQYFTGPPANVWLRYKKFGKNWNVYPNIKERVILFPTKPKLGVRLVIKYENKSTTDEARFSANLFNFCDRKKVDVSVGEQGEDW